MSFIEMNFASGGGSGGLDTDKYVCSDLYLFKSGKTHNLDLINVSNASYVSKSDSSITVTSSVSPIGTFNLRATQYFFYEVDLDGKFKTVSIKRTRSTDANRCYMFVFNTNPNSVDASFNFPKPNSDVQADTQYGPCVYPSDITASHTGTIDVTGLTGKYYIGFAEWGNTANITEILLTR